MQVVETLRKGSAGAEPATCTCRQRKLTAGGWLTTQETEGYGSPLARTTTYIYNAQYRVARINRPDGGYTEYTYTHLHPSFRIELGDQSQVATNRKERLAWAFCL